MFGNEYNAAAHKPSLSVIGQIRTAWKNKAIFALGIVLGSIAPSGAFLGSHSGLDNSVPLYTQPVAYAVVGLLAFSIMTVVKWFYEGFQSYIKAIGLAVGMEIMMVFLPPSLRWFSYLMLAALMFVNGVATASLLSLAAQNDTEAASMPSPVPVVPVVPEVVQTPSPAPVKRARAPRKAATPKRVSKPRAKKQPLVEMLPVVPEAA